MPVTLGIDIGTTNTKAVLVDPGRLQVRALASAPTPEPVDLHGTLRTLIADVLADQPEPDAVGIASMAETGVPLAADGTPLSGWLRWTDHPAAAEAEILAGRLGRDHLIGATGARPSAKIPLARWLWLRTHRPDLWKAMSMWAGVADLATFLLTGRLVTDHTLAGRTMAYRLSGGGAFDAELLAEVGLRPRQLPPVALPGEIAAFVRGSALGLRPGTPVVVAGHDHAVGSYACGVREPGDVADSVGTAEAVMTVVAGDPDPVPIGRAGMSTVRTVDGRHKAVLAGSPSAGALIAQWPFALLTDTAEVFTHVLASGDEPTDLLVLPYPAGRQSPFPDPRARLRVIGRRPGHTPVDLAKALLEGLSLHTRWMLDEQARLADAPGDPTVHLFGGPVAANPAWTRIKSRILPGTLRVIGEQEPVAIGAALLAAARTGCVDPPVPALHWRPAPEGRADYEPAFEAFKRAARSSTASTNGGTTDRSTLAE